MKLLVVSDIHAMSKELEDLPAGHGYFGNDGSFFQAENRSRLNNPILGISDALSDLSGQIDVLVCVGDLAHQAKQLPLLQVWHDIHETAAVLQIKHVLSVTGNHDIASRVDDIHGAEKRKEFLKSITPPFPSREMYDSYHRDGVGFITVGNCLIAAIDTCSLHGLGSSKASEVWSVGAITTHMMAILRQEVKRTTCSHVVVVMHHHPLRVDEVADPDYDAIASGAEFLTFLGDSGKCCVVIHGHKHMVRLKRVGLGSVPPVVLSSASIAAYPYRGQEFHYSNQFHVVDVDTAQKSYPSGVVYSWDWGLNRWERSRKPSMPHIRYFGLEPDLQGIIQQLSTMPMTGYVPLSALLTARPDIKYMSPEQYEFVNIQLQASGRQLVSGPSGYTGMVYEERRA